MLRYLYHTGTNETNSFPPAQYILTCLCSVEDEVTTSKDDVSSEKDEHDDQDSLEDDDHDLAKQYGGDDSQVEECCGPSI